MTSTTQDRIVHEVPAEVTSYFASEQIGHVLDGVVVGSADGATMPVIDPATGEQVTVAAAGSAEDVDRAVRSARAAYEDGRWRDLAPAEKERRLRKLGALAADNAQLLADLDVVDGGVLRLYGAFVAQFGFDACDYYAGWPTKRRGTATAVPLDLHVTAVREPVGVIALIMPWNAPSAVLAGIALALATGNSVVVKPAEQTPVSAVLLAKLCTEAGIPPGVVNVVQGTGEAVGAALVAHPGIDKVSFTGSVETGRAVQVAAAARLTRVTLELGGKSPFIVFDDADLEAAVPAAISSVWGGSGQVCTAGTRLLVQRSIHDEFVAGAVAMSSGLRVGSGFDPNAHLGPLVSQEQLDRVQRYVGIGQEEGAQLALGGHRFGSTGFFHEPTIFTGVRNDMRIAQEEIFGPVMSIIPFDDEADAYRIANDVEYGLSAGVWTSDVSRAQRASRALHVGTVWVNTYQQVNPAVSYGGVKQSGYGRMLGEESLDAFTTVKSIWTKVPSISEGHTA
ncbi:MAG: aldehyde dehydrogenase [Mycobacteriales bacterium]